jgi:hypothetical protein
VRERQRKSERNTVREREAKSERVREKHNKRGRDTQ